MNRLKDEKSPYLQQHARNPVDWFPWSEEAFLEAERRDRPVFLSIGYSTCHWCHVMERESFEDEEVAALLNEHFVSVKVDREERPDVDHLYMTVCQAMTGHGGWPLTVLMTPDKKPFYVGTYFPKHSLHGRPGLMDVLRAVSRKWTEDRSEITRISETIVESIELQVAGSHGGELRTSTLHDGYHRLSDAFDGEYGGFGGAPKFPTPHNLGFLLRYWRWTGEEEALDMVETTLRAMHAGGIYDHLGYGFARYSVDRKWLVPHFEKMLYDNAMLAAVYLEAYQATGRRLYARVADEVFQYVLRDMTSPGGGFYSAEDADSEGEEGKFYVWSRDEIHRALGEEIAERFCRWYGVSGEGNFEGKDILNRIHARETPGEARGRRDADDELAEARATLFALRAQRVPPHKDDKILTSWNALMITALARGARILGSRRYLDAAVRAAEFIWARLRDRAGRLLARYRDGEAAFPGYIDDYAFLVQAMLDLYDADMKPLWLQRGMRLQEEQDRLFWDAVDGGYYFYGCDAEELLARPKRFQDGALPSGNGVAATNLFRLERLTGNGSHGRRGRELLESYSGDVRRHPSAYTQSLMATMLALLPGLEVVVASRTDTVQLQRDLQPLARVFAPDATYLYRLQDGQCAGLEDVAPFTSDMGTRNGETTFYVCRNYACQEPTHDVDQVISELTREGV